MKIPRINNQIKAEKVRLISEDGKNLGIFSLKDALSYARERNLDLIEVAANANPPVCRLGDFGKYLYQQKKKEREQRKKQKFGKVKTVRITPRISSHDLETKTKQALKFLEKGYKVRLEIFLRGREKALSEFGKERLQEFVKKIEENIEIKKEGEIKRNPRGLEIIIFKK